MALEWFPRHGSYGILPAAIRSASITAGSSEGEVRGARTTSPEHRIEAVAQVLEWGRRKVVVGEWRGAADTFFRRRRRDSGSSGGGGGGHLGLGAAVGTVALKSPRGGDNTRGTGSFFTWQIH
jgi:hypothetical protein